MDNNDWKLLQEYAHGNSERAFHELVRRYAGLVHASAFRQTGDAPLAQDVAQAVFTLLSRKARSLRPGTILSGWLFQTTRFVAQRAVRSEQRRRKREQEAMNMQQLQSGEEAWRQMAPVIDQAVGRLAAGDREVILLRHFEGRTVREVGSMLGISEEGAKKRLARALEKLRHILTRNGVTFSTALIAAALSDRAVAAVADPFATALASGALTAEAGSSVAAALARESLAAWRRIHALWTMGGVATLALVAFLAVTFKDRWPSATVGLVDRSATRIAPANEEANVPVSFGVSAMRPDPKLRQLTFRAVAADSGAPLSNAPVLVSVWQKSSAESLENHATDEKGLCRLAIPADALGISVGVMADGWAARYAMWPSEGQNEIPPEYTLRLWRVTNSIGGAVHDPAGNPLADVEIYFMGHDFGDSSHRERPRERFGFVRNVPVARTDRDGRWSIAFVPADHPGFQIEGRHSKYADTMLAASGKQRGVAEITDDKLRALWEGRLVTTMKAAFVLTGQVVDENDIPIRDGRIQAREQSEIFFTDQEGRFAVPKLPAGNWTFTATAEGFAPVRTNASIGANSEARPLIVKLKPGATLRLRAIDENGIEVPDAEVGLEQWGENRHDFHWRTRTDFHGRVEWNSAPPRVELELFARKEGFCYTRDIRLVADGTEHTISLHRTLELYGHVTDARTGLPIGSFKAEPGYGREDRYHDSSLRWFAGETVLGSNGAFKLTFVDKVYPWQVRVRADGYEDWTSEPLTNRIQDVIDIAMVPAGPERSVRGVVFRPDGAVAAGAQIALLTFEHSVVLRNQSFEGQKRWVIRADEAGAFSFPPNSLAHSVAAVSEDGYVRQRLTDFRTPLTLRLESWGRVEGIVEESAVGPGLSSVELYDPTADNYQGRVSLLGAYSVKADARGRFHFENVPPGEFCVFVNSGIGVTYHHQTPVTVRPGDTAQITIADKPGTRIKGRFTAPNGQAVDWRKDFVVSHFYADLPQAGQLINAGPKSELRRRELEFWDSPLGREHVNHPRVYSAVVFEDGSFATLENLPAGKYRFTTVFKNPAAVNFSATLSVEVKDGALPVLPLGDIPLR